jgi:TonB family protein
MPTGTPLVSSFASVLLVLAGGMHSSHAAIPSAGCDAAPQQMKPPVYPEHLKGTKIGGSVVLLVTLDACGNVTNVGIERSSRNRDLDRAAMEGARLWRLAPASNEQVNVEQRRVRVPVDFTKAGVEFVQDAGEQITGRPRDDFFQERRRQSAPRPSRAADGGIHGYIADAYPIGVGSVAEGVEYIERHGRRQPDPAPSVRTYEVADAEGISFWVLDEQTSGTRALMRQRMVGSGGDTFVVTSWLCEPLSSEGCDQFRAFLERMPSQPGFGPLPPPAPVD